MSASYLVPMATGLALGFGLASVAYLGIFVSLLKQAHIDAVAAADALREHHEREELK